MVSRGVDLDEVRRWLDRVAEEWTQGETTAASAFPHGVLGLSMEHDIRPTPGASFTDPVVSGSVGTTFIAEMLNGEFRRPPTP